MKKHQTIFDILTEAISNNGIVSIYNYEKENKIKNATQAKILLNKFFCHTLKFHFFIFPLTFGSRKKITASQRQFLNKIQVTYKDNGLSFNVYDLLCLPENLRNTKTLNLYIDFFNICKNNYIKSNAEQQVQILNEYQPSRLEVNVDGNDHLTELLNEFLKIDEFKEWAKFILKGLIRTGLYSWLFINEDGLLSFNELHHLLKEKYKDFL